MAPLFAGLLVDGPYYLRLNRERIWVRDVVSGRALADSEIRELV